MKKVLLFTCLVLMLGVSSAFAAITPILYPGGYNEPWLDVGRTGYDSILSVILTSEYAGVGSWTRVDDGLDQVWGFAGATGTAEAEAKFAGYAQYLYAGQSPVSKYFLFSLPSGNNGYKNGSPSVTFDSSNVGGLFFKFYNDPNAGSAPGIYSSLESENPWYTYGQYRGRDRMVTFMHSSGDYFVGWEDGTDYDFNDVCYLFKGVAPVPEPGSMTLLGLGVLGLFGLKRKKIA